MEKLKTIMNEHQPLCKTSHKMTKYNTLTVAKTVHIYSVHLEQFKIYIMFLISQKAELEKSFFSFAREE